MDPVSGVRTCLYDAVQLGQVIDDMARRLAGLLGGCERLAVIGILRRGAPLADRLSAALVQRHHCVRPLRLDLAVKRYADDLSLLYPETRLSEDSAQAGVDLRAHTLLVVDDVLYTGHSLLKVVEHLARRQPAEIRTAVLVDRGVTLMPVRTDVVGVRLDIAPSDIIECHVPPYEACFGIELVQRHRDPC
jgi:pyrimidine operon attenuation protein/uracil phosphoribosyltransferase